MIDRCKFAYIAIVAMLFIAPACAFGTLIQINSGGASLVYDDVNEVYWQADVSRYTNLDWNGVSDKLDTDNQLGYGGITNWELTDSAWELTEQMTEDTIRYFTPTYSGYEWNIYGRVATGGDREDGQLWANYEQIFTMVDDERILFADGYINDNESLPHIGAWIKSVGPINKIPIPEPSFILLFGFGILALSGVEYSRNRVD